MPTDDAILLDINSLLAGDWEQCQALLLYSYPGQGHQQSISNEHLSQLLNRIEIDSNKSLLDCLQPHLEAVEGISAEQFSILKFTDKLFNNYLINCRLDPNIAQQLKLLRPKAADSLLQQQLPWSEKALAAKLLSSIYQHTIGCQQSLGKAAERFTQQLTDILKADYTPKEIQIALKVFFEKERVRVRKLEQRLCDVELGTLHAKHASLLSAKTLNQNMAGKKLPFVISQFLQGPWRESMRLTIISDGRSSDNWQRLLRLTETLIWSFQPFDQADAEYRQHVYDSISEISEQLREVAVGLHHSSKLDEELANIEAEHLKILKGEELEYQTFQLIDNSDPLLSSQVSMSKALIKSATAFEEGQWFIDHVDGEEKHIKLSLKIIQAQQLLFTNFLGIKAAQYSFEEFAYRLSSKIIIPIKSADPFKATGEKMLDHLLKRQQQQQQKAASDAALEKEAMRQQELSRQAAREKALQEAKAHSEAQKAARLKAQQEAEKIQAKKAHEKQQHEATGQLDKLTIGGIIIFYDAEHQGEQCKLAAVIQSSGDHIFVNRQGIKHQSLNKQQLAEKLIDGTAKLIDYGSNFDNTLETVVNNLRTRK